MIRTLLRTGTTAVGAALVLTVATATPAGAATSEAVAWWNDRPIVKAWFNSGDHRPDLGRNSFTVKVEEGSSTGTLWYQIDGRPEHTVTVNGSGNERTFSVSGAVNPDLEIGYGVCGEIQGYRSCSAYITDWVR
jgi:hypothetical protein